MKKKPFQKLVFLRAMSPTYCDEVGVCALLASTETVSERPLAATWIIVDPLLKQGSVFSPGEQPRDFELQRVGKGALLEVPKAISDAVNLPAIVCFDSEGFLENRRAMDMLTTSFKEQLVVVIGMTAWLKTSFSATPMGYKLSDDTWSVFSPAGAAMAIEISLPVSASGVALDLDRFAANVLETATILFERRCALPVEKTLVCDAEGFLEAFTLVVMRKAWGRLPQTVLLPKGCRPGWRRLIQHLGGEPKTYDPVRKAESQSVNEVPMRAFSRLLPKLDKKILMQEMSSHSHIIPDQLMDQF